MYELGYGDCSKAYVFRGDKTYTPGKNYKIATNLLDQIKDQLGLLQNPNAMQVATKRFLVPLSDCEVLLSSVIEELTVDPWPIKPQQRPKRCTGTALSVATYLLEASYANCGARIMLFLGGAW